MLPFPTKGGQSSKSASTADPRLVSGVNRDNYDDMARAFMELRQTKDGFGVMIDRDKNPTQWRAWMGYFQRKNIRHAFMKRRDVYMVPADLPSMFDLQA